MINKVYYNISTFCKREQWPQAEVIDNDTVIIDILLSLSLLSSSSYWHLVSVITDIFLSLSLSLSLLTSSLSLLTSSCLCHYWHLFISVITDILSLSLLTSCLSHYWYLVSVIIDTLSLSLSTSFCLCYYWHLVSVITGILSLSVSTPCLCRYWHLVSVIINILSLSLLTSCLCHYRHPVSVIIDILLSLSLHLVVSVMTGIFLFLARALGPKQNVCCVKSPLSESPSATAIFITWQTPSSEIPETLHCMTQVLGNGSIRYRLTNTGSTSGSFSSDSDTALYLPARKRPKLYIWIFSSFCFNCFIYDNGYKITVNISVICVLMSKKKKRASSSIFR